MTTRYHKSEFLTFASCQLVAASNEDRISTCMNHVGSDHGSFSSFGVFDGHQGVSMTSSSKIPYQNGYDVTDYHCDLQIG